MKQEKLTEHIAEKNKEVGKKFDPLMATFQESKKEPYHRWYPYLEGYSTSFVRTIIDNYMRDSEVIFDPFAGTVATGFEAVGMGKKSLYCEINPILQFIADVKFRVKLLEERKRDMVAKELDIIAEKISKLIEESEKHKSLDYAYESAFEGSEFFFERTYRKILKMKSALSDLESESKLVSDLTKVAALSALVPCSKLKRAGDLRYMSDSDLDKKIPNLEEKLVENISVMSEDIRDTKNKIKKRPLLIAENAKNLNKIPKIGIDGLITSPPYINGTNYFRNTKLELWFLGCIRNSKDLRRFREKALTAGINTVNGDYKIPDVPLIKKVVSDLENDGYDRRLPLMVSGYFSELQDIFAKIERHLNRKATLAIDIGDSKYAGIHVPVDKMLIKSLEQIGYNFIESVKLRDRYSNDGEKLKQVLLIFGH